MAIDAEQLNVILSARDEKFAKAMERSQKRVEMFAKKSGKNLSKASASFDALGSAAKRLGPAIAAAFSVQAIRGAIDAAAKIGELSRLAGISSDEFQILSATSTQFGIGQEKLADILKDVNDKFGDFTATGAGPLKDFFEFIAPQVGLTAAAFADLSSDQKLGAYVSALEKANVTQSEMTFYMEAIASDSTALVGAFEKNSAAIDEMREKAKSLGIVLDESLIQNAQEARGQLDLMSRVINAQLSSALIELAPLLVNAATGVAAVTNAVSSFLSLDFSGMTNTALLDAEGLKNLANEYSGLEAELGKVTQAQAAYNRHADSDNHEQAAKFLKRKTEAEQELRSAIAKRQAQEQAGAAAVSGIQDMAATTKELREQARLNSMSAEARERERISRERMKIEAKIINDINASGTEATIDQQIAVGDLGYKYQQAAISASKILNPIEKAASGTRSIKKEATAATEEYKSLADQMTKVSPLLQQLGFDAESLDSVMNTVEGSMESAFMGMIDGTMNAKDAFRSMATSIIKELYRVLVVQRLVSAISGAIFGGGGGAVATSIRPMARPMASGGSVQSGQPYVTGEHGRELFVPSQNGRILSVAQSQNAARSGGGDGVTVIQNNTFGSGVTRAEVNALLPKMVAATKAAVVDAKLRGGTYGGAF